MTRSPDVVLAFISAVDVTRCAAFFPVTLEVDGKPMPVSRCNSWTVVYCAAMGAPIPNATANELHDWLVSAEAQMAGWKLVDPITAALRASLGYVVVASWKNPNGHGHIAPLVPPPPADPSSLYVSAAGAENFVRCKVERSFGAFKPDYLTFLDAGDPK